MLKSVLLFTPTAVLVLWELNNWYLKAVEIIGLSHLHNTASHFRTVCPFSREVLKFITHLYHTVLSKRNGLWLCKLEFCVLKSVLLFTPTAVLVPWELKGELFGPFFTCALHTFFFKSRVKR